jgi:hypothetical protein
MILGEKGKRLKGEREKAKNLLPVFPFPLSPRSIGGVKIG